jgi:hypothetical protein
MGFILAFFFLYKFKIFQMKNTIEQLSSTLIYCFQVMTCNKLKNVLFIVSNEVWRNMTLSQKYVSATVFAVCSMLTFTQSQLVFAESGRPTGSTHEVGTQPVLPSGIPVMQNPFTPHKNQDSDTSHRNKTPSDSKQITPPTSETNWKDFAKKQAEELIQKKIEFNTTKKEFEQKIQNLNKQRVEQRKKLLETCRQQEKDAKAQLKVLPKHTSINDHLGAFGTVQKVSPAPQASPTANATGQNGGQSENASFVPCREQLLQFEKETKEEIHSIRKDQSSSERSVLGLSTEVPYLY